MQNFAIKIDILKTKGSFVTNIKGNTTTKKCLVIPIEDAGLFLGEKGIYLDLVAFEMKDQKFADTHLVKASLSKEAYEAMTEEQRNNAPILGSMKPLVPVQREMPVTSTASPENVDDLPF